MSLNLFMKKALAAVYVLPMYSCILKFKSLAISRKVRDFTQNPLKKQTVLPIPLVYTSLIVAFF